MLHFIINITIKFNTDKMIKCYNNKIYIWYIDKMLKYINLFFYRFYHVVRFGDGSKVAGSDE